MKDKLFIILQYILPQHALSAVMHRVARCTKPWFKHFLITRFIQLFQVNMAEADESNPGEYESFNAFLP